DAADHDGKLCEARRLEFVCRERLVGGAEVDGSSLDLGDSAPRTDGLIVDFIASGLLEVRRPFGQHRIDERRSRTGNAGRSGSRRTDRENGYCNKQRAPDPTHRNESLSDDFNVAPATCRALASRCYGLASRMLHLRDEDCSPSIVTHL